DSAGISIHVVSQQISRLFQSFLFSFLARRVRSCTKRLFGGMVVNSASHGALDGPLSSLNCTEEELHAAAGYYQVLDIFLGIRNDGHCRLSTVIVSAVRSVQAEVSDAVPLLFLPPDQRPFWDRSQAASRQNPGEEPSGAVSPYQDHEYWEDCPELISRSRDLLAEAIGTAE